ncbi:hypothetical protein V6N11_024540 [Hibiscus sabdariffa]|uniref:Uncharacterized protein n=1 Tax=Hibiscus sabdariffa TaxID=183260 RepID=A0ABR2QMF0_9ROSI
MEECLTEAEYSLLVRVVNNSTQLVDVSIAPWRIGSSDFIALRQISAGKQSPKENSNSDKPTPPFHFPVDDRRSDWRALLRPGRFDKLLYVGVNADASHRERLVHISEPFSSIHVCVIYDKFDSFSSYG